MTCEKAGCEKKAINHLTLINKKTKEKHDFFLCQDHYNAIARIAGKIKLKKKK